MQRKIKHVFKYAEDPSDRWQVEIDLSCLRFLGVISVESLGLSPSEPDFGSWLGSRYRTPTYMGGDCTQGNRGYYESPDSACCLPSFFSFLFSYFFLRDLKTNVGLQKFGPSFHTVKDEQLLSSNSRPPGRTKKCYSGTAPINMLWRKEWRRIKASRSFVPGEE